MAKPNTVREFVNYEYSKLIANRVIGPRPQPGSPRKEQGKYWGFVAHTYKKLMAGEVNPSDIARENKLLVMSENVCAYCGSPEELQWEHIIPRSRGGSDAIDNLVLACRQCNQSKGARDPIEWYSPMKREVPRLVMGKFLKLVFERHRELGTVDEPLPRSEDGKRNWCSVFEAST